MLRVKETLKAVPFLYSVNARWKARRIKSIYFWTLKYYGQNQSAESAESLLDRRAGDRLARWCKLGRPLNFFFLGTDEQQDRSGILQALEKCAYLTCFSRADGAYGQNYRGTVEKRRRANTERLWQMCRQLHLQGEAPDILVAQTWASFIDPGIFTRLREAYSTVVVNIAMDDRHQYWGSKVKGQWGGTYGLIPHIDLALTAAPEAVEWYLKEGCPAMFFPEASDPEIFHPMLDLPKVHDVCFVGARYGIRKKIVSALMKAGISVTTYGDGWDNGRIQNERVPQLFAQSKVILGVGTIGHCDDFYALKMRDFDGPMSGSLYLTHDNADLHRLYEVGEEIVTYRSIGECVGKVKYYLEHDGERERIARAGHARATRDHTWFHRFSGLRSFLLTIGERN